MSDGLEGVAVEKTGQESQWSIRRLRAGDEGALAQFYNGLSEASRRTFRPLGWQTTTAKCAEIVEANQAGSKYDLIAAHNPVAHDPVAHRIVGWGFVWDLGSEEPNFGLGVADAYQGRGWGAR